MSEGQKRRAARGGFTGHPITLETRIKISNTLKRKGIRPSLEACSLGGKTTQGAK